MYGALDVVPLSLLFVGTAAIVLCALEGGFRLGTFARRSAAAREESALNTEIGATLGLLAFLLAFTFGLAASRYDARRSLVLDESNAIGTAFLRADFLPEPERRDIRRLLREYVNVRLEAVQPGKLQEATHKSEQLHEQMWARAVAGAKKAPNSVAAALFVRALNDVIDLHAKRIMAALGTRIPGVIWLVLYVVAVLGMTGMGYHAGLSGTRRSLAVLSLALSFSAVIWLIADLDRPHEGLVTVSQQTMLDLRSKLNDSRP